MEEIDLKELFRIFWNKKYSIIIIVLVFIAMGFVYTACFVDPVYTSSTKLVLAASSKADSGQGGIDTSSISTTDITINSRLVSTYSEVIKSNGIMRKVINNLRLDIDESTLKKGIEVSRYKDTEVIEIKVTNKNPKIATDVANEVVDVFIDTVEELYKIENVYILDEAEIPDSPSNIHHMRDVALFGAIGAVVAAAYVFILNMLDTTIKTAEEIESTYKIPVLASIPIYSDNIEKDKKGGKRNGKRANSI